MYRSWICACALLAGCAGYQPKPITLEREAQLFEQRTLADAQLRQCMATLAWPVTNWDSDLLTVAARCYNPGLEVARKRWEAAKAGIITAGAHSNPVLQFPFEYATNQRDGASPYTTGPALDIPLKTAGKRGHQLDQASWLAQAAALNLTNEEWRLRSQVRDALLGLYGAQQRLQIQERQTILLRQMADMLRRREDEGAAARPEVRQAALHLLQAQTEQAVSRRLLLESRARLAAVIGVPMVAMDDLTFDFSRFEKAGALPPAEPVRRAALLRRADLLAALADYEASQSALQLEVSHQYPDIHLGAGYTFDAGTRKISLGLASLTLPLLDRNQGPIAQAEARRGEVAAYLGALQDKIINDATLANSSYLASLQAWELAERSLAAAARQRDSQVATYDAGMLDRLALARAQADYLGAAASHLRARITMQQAAGALEDALQQALPANGRLSPPLEYGQ